MAFKFEQLKVWQKALDLTEGIDIMTKKFSKEELFVLTSQIKRATDSIALNIAEGSTGQSNSEFKKFLGYSIRSGIEVVACLHVAKRRKLVNEEDFNDFYNKSEEIIKMLQALRKSIN
ncbi:MAG TPA: four helix bundle protein [Cytophagaceae bacterium]|jgi:four helix bundle protein|nr:four helix bundle protein [Cytophagaceae bacterium]